MTLSWPSQIGQTYRVVYNSGINGTNWTQLGSTITAVAATTTATDTTAPQNGARFYRVISQ